jgi:hypothetical protein
MTDDAKKPGRKGFGVNFKVSAKGAVSVYGLGRFPVTLYREQWVRLLERADDLKTFMDEHADELAKKTEPQPEAALAETAAAATAAPAAATRESSAPAEPDADPDLPPDDYDGLS